MRKSLKTVIATVLVTAAMTITAVAGSMSFNSPFTVQHRGGTVRPASATFSSKSDHTMKVSLGKVETAGDACVGISSKGIFGYKSLDSETFYLKKGNYAGTYYQFDFDDISKGTRYYSFSADINTKYTVSSFSDSW